MSSRPTLVARSNRIVIAAKLISEGYSQAEVQRGLALQVKADSELTVENVRQLIVRAAVSLPTGPKE